MIKKFNEYIKEGESRKKEFTNFIPIEEVEDQFLRLKEVLGCKIGAIYPSQNIINAAYGYNIQLFYDQERKDAVEKELERIKNRLESMFPVRMSIKIGNIKGLPSKEIWIRLK